VNGQGNSAYFSLPEDGEGERAPRRRGVYLKYFKSGAGWPFFMGTSNPSPPM
jgi:hypothetical protein